VRRPEPGKQDRRPTVQANQALVNARDIAKTYSIGKRSLEVLRHLNLTVARGDFLSVRGASGAGKSTLMHLLGGLDVPTAGEVWFDGRNLRRCLVWNCRDFAIAKSVLFSRLTNLLPELDALEMFVCRRGWRG